MCCKLANLIVIIGLLFVAGPGHATPSTKGCEAAASRSPNEVAVGLLKQGYGFELIGLSELKWFSENARWVNPFKNNSKHLDGINLYRGFHRVLPLLNEKEISMAQALLKTLIAQLQSENSQIKEAKKETRLIFGKPQIVKTFALKDAEVEFLGLDTWSAIETSLDGRPIFVVMFKKTALGDHPIEMLFDPMNPDSRQQMIEIRSGEVLKVRHRLVAAQLGGIPYLISLGDDFVYDLKNKRQVPKADVLAPFEIAIDKIDSALVVDSRIGPKLVLFEYVETSVRIRMITLSKNRQKPEFLGKTDAYNHEVDVVGGRSLVITSRDQNVEFLDVDEEVYHEPLPGNPASSLAGARKRTFFFEEPDRTMVARIFYEGAKWYLKQSHFGKRTFEEPLVVSDNQTFGVGTFQTHEGLHYFVDGKDRVFGGSLVGGPSYQFPVERSEPRLSKVVYWKQHPFYFRVLRDGQIHSYDLAAGAPVAKFTLPKETQFQSIFTYNERIYGFFTPEGLSPVIVEFTTPSDYSGATPD